MTNATGLKMNAMSAAPAGELTTQVEIALSKARQTQRPFFVVLIQIQNLAAFRRRRSADAANRLIREIHAAVRRAVHASQHVGIVRDGVAVVFDAAEPGQVDLISSRLAALCQGVLRAGGYNDLSSSWSDMLYQFLVPGNGGVMEARAGWAIHPRDGDSAVDIVKRAWASLGQTR